MSEVVGLILIAFLIILVALIITMALTGTLTKFLQQPALVTLAATQVSAGTDHIIRLDHKQGNKVNLNGTSQKGGSGDIAIYLTDPLSGRTYNLQPLGTIDADAFGPGQSLYIYQGAAGFGYDDTLPGSGALNHGENKLLIIDAKNNLLLQNLTVIIT